MHPKVMERALALHNQVVSSLSLTHTHTLSLSHTHTYSHSLRSRTLSSLFLSLFRLVLFLLPHPSLSFFSLSFLTSISTPPSPQVIRKVIDVMEGYEVKTEGDAFMVAFPTPVLALKWAIGTHF